MQIYCGVKSSARHSPGLGIVPAYAELGISGTVLPRISLRAGYDIRKIQVLMGHSSLASTMIYVHVSKETLSKIKSPLDLFDPANKEAPHDSDK